MTEIHRNSARGRAFLRWLVATAFVLAVIFSGLFTGLLNRAGLLYLVFGSVAAAFMGFTRREIGAAFRDAAGLAGTDETLARSAYFWEAAARNAWILGVLGSAMNFAIALGSKSGGIAAISHRMIQSFVVTLYGLVLAVLCLVPAIKIAGKVEKEVARDSPPAGGVQRTRTIPARAFMVERVTSYIGFAAVLVLTALPQVQGHPQGGNLPIAKVMLHGPAILVVFGGAIALALFMGAGARGWTLGFGMTGLVGLFLGLIQALFGFVHTNIREISSALAFIISASSFALLGLVAVAAPLEDREVMAGRRERPASLSRMFWSIFPLLVFIFLLLAFIMVVTPMKVPGGG